MTTCDLLEVLQARARPNRLWRAVLVGMIVAACSLYATSESVSRPPRDDDNVQLLIRTSPDRKSDRKSARMAREVTQLVPSRKVYLPRDTTISHVLDRSGVGPRMKTTYKFLVDETLKINKIERADRIPSDTILVPNLAPRNELLNVKVSRSQVKDLTQTTLWKEGRITIAAQVGIALESARPLPPDGTDEFLTDEERARVARFAATTRRPAYLFLFDTGWPSPDAYRFSRQFVFETIDDMRSFYGFRPKRRADVPFAEAACDHSEFVTEAIEPLESNTTDSDQVIVVHIPLSLEQNSRDVIGEMLEIHYLLDLAKARSDWDERTPSLAVSSLTDENYREAGRWADNITATISPDLGGCSSEKVYTNSAVLFALKSLAEFLASKQKTMYFINLSWVVRRNQVDLPPVTRGVYIVAAGNSGFEVVEHAMDFGQRFATRKEIVTVVNLDNDGSQQCSTSFVDAVHLSLGNVVGFNGRLSNETCGTSFAAPRVAWYLALGASVFPSRVDGIVWINKMSDAIAGSRIASQDGEARGQWDPLQFLSLLTGGE